MSVTRCFRRQTIFAEARPLDSPLQPNALMRWKAHKVTRKSSIPPVADVALLAGVGAITVSRTVNGTGYVSAEKRRKISAAIKKLGYRPNQAARVLKGHRARMIGLIVPNLSDPFFGMCASAIEEYAFQRGYMTLVVASKRNHEIEKNQVDMMMSQNVAGLVIVPSLPNDRLKLLAASGVPIVALDRPSLGMATDEVVVENLGGARTAVEHLLWHGHKKIACIGYDKTSYSISQRILGYMETLRQAGLQADLYDNATTSEAIDKIVRSWMQLKERPTALFSLNNVTTLRVLQSLKEAGYTIPQQMAVVGFDDFSLASLLSPPLTAVRQPSAHLGMHAARLLFDRIGAGTHSSDDSGIKLVLPVEFVIRASCGCGATEVPTRRATQAKA
jgi:LacI family transcriptional regulator